MRKTIAWAAIVLLLVVSLQNPVVSRTTPYTSDDFGPNPDHPWGGDQNSVRQQAEPASTITGLPVIDLIHLKIWKWLFVQPVGIKQNVTITHPSETPNTPQTSGSTSNPNIAN